MILHDIILQHSEAESFGSLSLAFFPGHSIFRILWVSESLIGREDLPHISPRYELWKFSIKLQPQQSTLQNSKIQRTKISALSTHIKYLPYNAPKKEKRRNGPLKNQRFEASIINMLMFHLYRDLPRIRLPAVCWQRPTKKAELGSVGIMSLTRRFHENLGEWQHFSNLQVPEWLMFMFRKLLYKIQYQNHHSCGVL